MHALNSLQSLADQFVTERNWWQFHNPKNDAMNIMVETGELAEHFITADQTVLAHNKIAEEMSDILFGSFGFALLTDIDIAQSIGSIAGNATFKDVHSSYEQLQAFILQNAHTFNLRTLTTAQQVVLSLMIHTSQLADIFVWCTPEQSQIRSQEKHPFVITHIAHIVAHLMYLAHVIDIDLPTEYIAKMQKNHAKYPVDTSSEAGYIEIKDRSRGRK